MAAPTGKPETDKNFDKENQSPDQSSTKHDKSTKKLTSKPVTRKSTQAAAATIKDKYSKSKSDSKTTPAQKRKIVDNVNKILGLSKETNQMPKIPKLVQKPAAAAGSSKVSPSDPVMHSTPVAPNVMYPYRAPATPAADSVNYYDPVPQYMQDVSNIPPANPPQPAAGNTNQPMYTMAQQQNQTNYNQSQNPMMVTPPYQYPMYPAPQYMGTPRVVDKSSNLMVIPTPYYQNPHMIMDPNNIVTIPMGPPPVQNVQPANQQVTPSQNQVQMSNNQPTQAQQYANNAPPDLEPILPLEPDWDEIAENDINDLLSDDQDEQPNVHNDGDNAMPVLAPANIPHQPVLVDDSDSEDDFDRDSDADEEEIGPPIANEKLKKAVDSVWDAALKKPEGMNMKKLYGGIFRPSNVENLMKTMVNQLVRDNTAQQAFKNDGLPRSIHTAILKGALALVDTL